MLNHNNKIICNDHELGKVFNEHYILYIYMYIYIYIPVSKKTPRQDVFSTPKRCRICKSRRYLA